MSDMNIDPSIPCRIPRHLAQTLISKILQQNGSVFGLLYHDRDCPAIEAGDCCNDMTDLKEAIRRHVDQGHRPVGIFRSGQPNDLSLITAMVQAHACCPDITLLLELSADTKGRIELDGFIFRDNKLHPLNVQLEEDGILYPDCVNR